MQEERPDAQGTEERVRAAAVHLFASRGFEATGIREIARDAGISVASLYHYMPSKEHLLVGLIRDAMQRLLGPGRFIAGAAMDPAVAVGEMVRTHVRVHAEDNVRCTIADGELRSLTGDNRREIVGLRDQYQALWEQLIGEGAAVGTFEVPEVKTATFALLGMCTNVARWYAPGGPKSVEELAEDFVVLALQMLGCDPARAAVGPAEAQEGS
jgi:AcrR family transcriptional regulator